MTYSIACVFILFCAVVGWGLAQNHVNIWGVLGVLIAGIVTLQLAYFLGFIITHRGPQ